jgi:hypothetical protein
MKTRTLRAFLALCAALSAASLSAAVYFVDFSGGADTNDGTSTQTAWQHAPGDPAASGNPARIMLLPGDTVNFKGGVKYRGKIELQASGSATARIVFQGQPSGWGLGKAIIDGTAPLPMTLCTGQGTGAGQVPNPNFASIWQATLPTGADWRLPVFESDLWLDLAQVPSSNPVPFFFDDSEYFTALSSGITATTCRDPARFTQTDPAYWVGARILAHVSGNSIGDATITAYDPATQTVTYPSLGTPMADSNWDGKYHYTIVNSPRLISAPGQYAIDVAGGRVFVWPRADATRITFGAQPFGFSTNSSSYVTIDGFVIQGQYGTGFVPGRAINGSTQTATNGIVVDNCVIRRLAGDSSAAIYVYGAGTTENVVQNSILDHIRGRGAFVTGNKVAVRNNTLVYLTGTCIYSQNHSSAIPNINGDFSGNYIDSCRGVHQNAITVYGGSTAPATTWKIHDNIVRNFRQRHGNFGFSAQMHRDFIVYNNVFEADGGYAGDDLAAGSNYFRFYNNTVLGPVRIYGLANNTLADFRNNIARGLAIADAGSSSPVDWRKIIHANNVYTLLYYTQNSGTGWVLGDQESIASEDSLFAAPVLEYQLRVENTTAVDRGADLSAFIDGDFSGLVRPQGLAWDIGAVELAQTGLAFIVQPAGQTVPEGYAATFSAVTRGAAGYTLQWLKDSVAIPGATGTSYFIPSVSAADKGIYTLELTSADRQTTALSAPAGLNVNQPPYFAASPSPAQQIVPPGSNVLYSVTVSGLPAPTLQWIKDSVVLPGATTATLTLSSVTTASAGTYAVQATNSYGSVTSSGAQLIVGVPPSFTLNPTPASMTATPGTSVSYSVTASGLPAPSLQWRKDGVPLSGQTNATLVLASVTSADSGTYNATATNLAGSVVSAGATLAVATAPVFTAPPSPSSQTVGTGSSVYYSVAVSAVPAATLQWRKDDTPIPGATNSSLTLSNISLTDAGTYTVIATNSVGSTTSSGAVLMITTAPMFTTQPLSQMTAVGGTVTFTSAASDSGPISYQWRRNGSNIAGATNSTLSLGNVSATDAAAYTVAAANPYGTVISATALLTVVVPPVITTQPTNQSVKTGGTATFSVVATSAAPMSYQWRRNGTAIAGATGATLTISGAKATDAASYDVMVSNLAGSTLSKTVKLTVSQSRFGGTYFSPSGEASLWALHVRPDGTAVFIIALPGGDAIARLHFNVDESGHFAGTGRQIRAMARGAASIASTNRRTASAQGEVVTLEGNISDGRIVAQLVESALPIAGAFEQGGYLAETAGFYSAKALGDTLGWTRSIVGPTGRTVVLLEMPEGVDAATGVADAAGHLVTSTLHGGSVTLTANPRTRTLVATYVSPQASETVEFAGLIDDPPSSIQVSVLTPPPGQEPSDRLVEASHR